MKARLLNSTRIEGVLYQHNLELKVSGPNSKKPGALANVIMYAYPKGTQGEVTLSADVVDHVLCMEIRDQGIPFNPLQQLEADLDVPLEERQIGGLGIHLIKENMESLEYEYVEGENVLRMRKEVES